MSETVILVPRRDGVPDRDKAWGALRRRWEQMHPLYDVVEGHHDDGAFNRSMAINRAAAAAGHWKQAIIVDSDIFLAQANVEAAVQRAKDTGKVTWAFRRWRGIHEQDSDRIIRDRKLPTGVLNSANFEGFDMDLFVERTTPLSWSCCFVVPRGVFDELGGFDERFKGWGWEDMAFQSIVCGLYGHERLDGDVYHLWHPRSSERDIRAGRYADDYLRNSMLGRRYMVALRAETGQSDRAEPSSADEMRRDINNLKRDALYEEQRLIAHRPKDFPDWKNYWPSLAELRADSKARRDVFATRGDALTTSTTTSAVFDRTVTLIVHTDGRREYIARSIPSLTEAMKDAPVTRRVIYDDSGDPTYKRWLTEEFGPYGFYVVGPANRLGYTGSMKAMWSYLDRRCNTGFVFLAEDDFVYDKPVPVNDMMDVLLAKPYLRQMALLRHPFYERELEAGSIIAEHPEAYARVRDGKAKWMEHRLYFTANPSLFRRSLVRTAWPNGPSSEKVYTDILNRDPKSRMAYWGWDSEVVTHIGAKRAGNNY